MRLLTGEEMLKPGKRDVSQEILWANIYHDTIIGSKWIQNQPFSPGRAAIGYPTLYALYRILDEFQPKKILELGLGQSTKMIGSYVKWKENNGDKCEHIVVEHDLSWINFFSNMFELSSSTKIEQMNLKKVTIELASGETTEVNMYEDFAKCLDNKKFDLIFIDGPFGSSFLSRIDIIDLLPECLEKSFIMMLDDAERGGEQNTLKMMLNMLHEQRIDYAYNYYSGMKSTAIITSSDLHFYCTM